jgi:hypothetical protein
MAFRIGGIADASGLLFPPHSPNGIFMPMSVHTYAQLSASLDSSERRWELDFGDARGSKLNKRADTFKQSVNGLAKAFSDSFRTLGMNMHELAVAHARVGRCRMPSVIHSGTLTSV